MCWTNSFFQGLIGAPTKQDARQTMSEQAPLLEHATRDLAAFAAELRYEDIPSEVISHIKLCILDGIGAGLYGAHLPWTSIVQRVAILQAADWLIGLIEVGSKIV